MRCKCGGDMKPGTMIEPVGVPGAPDFVGDTTSVTMSSSAARLSPCIKCIACGHSIAGLWYDAEPKQDVRTT